MISMDASCVLFYDRLFFKSCTEQVLGCKKGVSYDRPWFNHLQFDRSNESIT